MNKKGQTGGLVSGLVFGVVGLVIVAIIALLIIQTVGGNNILTQDSITVTNETNAWVNSTNYTLTGFSGVGTTTPKIIAIWNATNNAGTYTVPVLVANATAYPAGVVNNGTAPLHWDNVSITYSYSRDSNEIKSANGLSGNLSGGVNNVSSKIPTVLLIAAIVLLLGILAVLVAVWQRMRMGGGSL